VNLGSDFEGERNGASGVQVNFNASETGYAEHLILEGASFAFVVACTLCSFDGLNWVNLQKQYSIESAKA